MVRMDDGGGGYPRDLPSVGDHVEVNRDVLRDVAKKLQADFDELNSWASGSQKDLTESQNSWVPKEAVGKYNAGQQIAGTFDNAYSQIGGIYQGFLGSYQQVISAIQRTVDRYQAAEDATADAANRANPGGQSGAGSGAW
jgi:hypothetical protein